MTYRIAEAAELVGVPTTTLRYYEDIGLVDAPARSDNGYRTYTDADVERLRFVAATKSIGIPLADVAELVKAYGVEDCSVVAHELVEMVAARLAQTQTRIGELVALAAGLQTVAARLAGAPTAGRCGATCPCATAASSPPAAEPVRTSVELTRPPDPLVESPMTRVACTLGATDVPDRVSQWQGVTVRAVAREPIPGGVALSFDASEELAGEIARLAAAEQGCCHFFTFTVRLTPGRVRLEVEAPADAVDVVAAMFGTTL